MKIFHLLELSIAQQGNIHVKKPFDYYAFDKQGNGPITTIVSPYNVEIFNEKELISKSYHMLSSNIVMDSTSKLDEKIRLIRYNAAINNIQEASIFTAIIKSLDRKIAHHQEHKYEKRNYKVIAPTSMSLAAFAAGVCATKYLSTKFDEHQPVIVISGIIASTFALVQSLFFFYQYLYPQHKEHIEKIELLKKQLSVILDEPYK